MSDLEEFFDPDSDTADTTLGSEVFLLPLSSPDTEEPPEIFVKFLFHPETPIMAQEIADALKALQKLKTRYLQIQKDVVAWDKNTVDDGVVAVAQARLEGYLLTFEGLYGEIYDNCTDANEFSTHVSDLEVHRVSMDKVHGIIMGIIKAREYKAKMGGGGGNGRSGSGPTPVQLKLPKLEMPTFDGKVENWLAFRDLFTSGVKDRVGLSGAQKLQYLLPSLKGEAEQLIKGLTLTDGNFDIAWKLLEDRFDNPQLVIFALLRKFFYQPAVSKECPKALQKLIDTSVESVRSLKVIDPAIDTDAWSHMLVFILVEKMDPETRRDRTTRLTGKTIPKFQEVIDFLRNHVRGLLAAGMKTGTSSTVVKSNHSAKFNAKAKSFVCYMCSEEHSLYMCEKIKALSESDREQFIKSKKCCLNCFGQKHSAQECKSKLVCAVCKQKHNTLLHRAKPSQGSSQSSDTPGVNTFHSGVQPGGTSVLLSTALVKVMDSFGSFRVCRVLLDPGSESSFVTKKCVTLLELKPSKCTVEVTGISSVSVGKAKGKVGLELASLTKDFEFDVNCLVYSQVTGILPSFSCAGSTWDYLRGLHLADPQFMEPREVDILLGADVTGFLSLPGRVMRDRVSPVASETELGWVISGPVNGTGLRRQAGLRNYSVRVHHSKVEVDSIIQRFWELEEVPEHPQWTAEEKECEQHFQIAHFREQGGRYGSPLPFNPKISGLGYSRFVALKRLEQVEKRLSRGTHRDQYVQFMREYEKLGHMEEVPAAECGEVLGRTNYLPHHFVTREESTTTKLRVVFDGSARTSTCLSFNDCLLVGPKVQDDLFLHLLRFRLYPIALKADIVKMFRQFLVSRSDADLQRILWRESPDQPVKEYRLKTVTYGTDSGPHSAARCMKQLSLDYLEESPEAAAVIGHNFYVDDLMTSVGTVDAGVKLQKGLQILAGNAGMEIGKWDSNNPQVLEHVSLESRAKNSKFKIEDDKFVSKALGVQWDSHNDFLLFEGFQFGTVERVTKRVVLSEMSRVFDPLGLLSPVTVKIKIFFQRLWNTIESHYGQSHVLGWDDELLESHKSEWDAYQQGMSRVSEVKIPRVLCVTGTQSFEIHGFSDASERAYSAVVYLRCFREDGSISVGLVCGKPKVAPLKSQTIPKLELCGGLLLARLITAVVTGTSLKCPIYAWTDSELVLKWLAGSSRRWETFVANRVAEIQLAIPNESWKFVPGEINPADCASRGMTADELLDHDLWWSGPDFLLCPGLPTVRKLPDSCSRRRRVLCKQGGDKEGVKPSAVP